MSFLEELAKEEIIKQSQIGEIKSRAQEKYGGDVDEALLESGITEEKILEAKGKYLQMPVKKVNKQGLTFDALKYISEDSATHYHFVPIELQEGVLEVGVLNGEDAQALDALQFISAKLGIPFKIYLISKSDYESIMQTYKGIGIQIGEALGELDRESQIEAKSLGEENLNKEIKNIGLGEEVRIVEDATVIKIVAVILRNALEGGASDIHIEHTGDKVKVRFRVDGILHTSLILPIAVYNGVIARIKILSKLRLDEKRKPQDGGFSVNIEKRKIDFRVSTMPSYYGEKVVMRILDSQKGVKPLSDLEMSPDNLALVREALDKPYGLILMTGPTGSGKTTTLYSMINELDH